MVKMIQLNSREEWLDARMGRIGGSEASAVIGRNPYCTNEELWMRKTGKIVAEDISDKPYVKYGNDAEPLLRKLFILDYPQYTVEYVENNMFLNDRYPFAHASLDGWLTDENGRKGVWECKTTNIMQSMQKEQWKDRIPDNYYIQVLHYLLVTEFEFAVLKAQMKYDYGGGDVFCQTKHYFIERAEVEDDIRYLEKEEQKFYENIRTGRKPGLLLPEL